MITTITAPTASLSSTFTAAVNNHLHGTGILYTGSEFDIPSTPTDAQVAAMCCVGLRAYGAGLVSSPTAVTIPEAALRLARAGVAWQ